MENSLLINTLEKLLGVLLHPIHSSHVVMALVIMINLMFIGLIVTIIGKKLLRNVVILMRYVMILMEKLDKKENVSAQNVWKVVQIATQVNLNQVKAFV